MDRTAFLDATLDCACGRAHTVPTKRIVIRPNALAALPALCAELALHDGGCVVADQTTWDIAGRQVAATMPNVRPCVLPSHHPHADLETATAVAQDVAGSRFLVSCGSGTITDLAKFAAHRHDIPLVAVATAPSMNGYTSGIVALTANGLKTTRSATPALALVADLDILCQAPLPMIRAGLGDLVSKPVCNADWKLASILRGEPFCEVPFRMIADLEATYLPQAAAINRGDREVIAALIEAIAYSGISMVLAGSSAPASGGEHLISHALDMQEGLAGRPLRDFHGTQVGVATLVMARLYDAFLALPRAAVDWQRASAQWEPIAVHAERLRATWGRAAPAVVEAFARKHPPTAADHAAAVAHIADRWKALQDAVAPFVANTPAIAAALHAANAKTSYRDLGLSREAFRTLVRSARFIRDRYCLLDLLDSIGQLDPLLAATLD